ncbi:ABC transporter substrate-binding protein [soil metagenome]
MKHIRLSFVFTLVTLVTLLMAACQPVLVPANPGAASAGQVPGVTDSEVIIGTHTSLTGPVAVYAPLPKAAKAYFDYINATEGGVNGRKITFLMEDDAYSPPKTVALVRKLVEQDHIFALFQGLGTPPHMQVLDYLQEQGVPDLYISASGREWIKDPSTRPMAFGGILGGVGEGAALGKYFAQTYAGKKLGFLYQNDDSGQDFTDGMKRTIGDALPLVAEATYEPTDKDLNAQVDRLKAAGVEVIGGLITPRLLATAIKHAHLDLKWNVPFAISHVSANDFLFALAGVDAVEGTLSVQYLRQAYEIDDPGVAKHAEIMKKYGGMDKISFLSIVGQYQAELLVETLRRAGKNLTRAGLVKAAESIHDFQCSVCLFPMSLSTTDHDPAQSAVYVTAQGGKWVPIGETGVSWEDTLPKDISTETVKDVPSPYKK